LRLRIHVLVFALTALALGGCGTFSGSLRAESLTLASPTAPVTGVAEKSAAPLVAPADEAASVPPEAAADVVPAVAEDRPAGSTEAVTPEAVTAAGDGTLTVEPITEAEMTPGLLALADSMSLAQTETDRSEGPPLEPPVEEYDPWEPFNEKIFAFNYRVDKYVLKPIAQAYNFIMPDELQRMVDRGFSNIYWVPRFVNSLLQGKWAGAGRELARFLINSTIGIGGLWDMAKQEWGIEPSKEDFGQTLGVWGFGPGPFLILPFLTPMTVRDGIGIAVDGAMDPLSYYIPFIWDRLLMRIGNLINERSLNLDLYAGVEETTVDLYTSVRNGYLQRRARQIKE
jgi:phospholipid-binding lipoprotein MlaA